MLASLSNSAAARRGTIVAIVAALGMAGCTEYEFDRPGTWKATGVNDHNLRVMVANPEDLAVGAGSITARGDNGSRAVTRLGNDRRRQLLNVSVSRVGASDSGSDNSSAGPNPGSSSSGGNTQ